MPTDLAPIALFVYNRPLHTRQTLEALSKNFLAEESTLYIFSDGPKNGAQTEDQKKIQEVRNTIRSKEWCKKVHLIERPDNIGLAASVIKGVSEIINQFGKIIVLEDDLVTSPYFLDYCNSGLELYKNEKNVYSINSFMFPVDFKTKKETFLCPLATSSWGWATWQDRWIFFKDTVMDKDIIMNDDFIRDKFNFGGIKYSDMIENVNSWAIKWYYSVFIRNGLGLFPTQSLVRNIGFDGTGVNSGIDDLKVLLRTEKIALIKEDKIDLLLTSRLNDYCKKKEQIVQKSFLFRAAKKIGLITKNKS
ncbi:MAG: glycosyltransferase family 2 protein [Bacteroidetes bacterium]|nr:glycosyltransferase family 2 protein [Bacteroidota bacterium]